MTNHKLDIYGALSAPGGGGKRPVTSDDRAPDEQPVSYQDQDLLRGDVTLHTFTVRTPEGRLTSLVVAASTRERALAWLDQTEYKLVACFKGRS